MARTVDLDQTRREIRHTFVLWDIDASEFEIIWEEERSGTRVLRQPGVTVRYLRNGQWQQIACYAFPTRAKNLRQCFLLLERLRIAEQQGVQYQGLTFTKDIAMASTEASGASKKEELLDALDTLGVSPDDPIELIKRVYANKSQFYHPDKGGDPEKFKRLDKAYKLILKSRGEA